MEEEEAALRKQLEETEDFDERREIRQKLRELRKKRLAAVETGTPTITDRERRREERRRQREQGNEENNGPTETRREEKTTTIDVVSSGETENNAAVKSFQLSVSTTQTTVVENGAVNGSAEEKESEDREDVEVSAENEMEDEPGQVETEQCDTEVDTVEQPTEGSADDKSAKKEEENGACKDETEGNTTLETLMVIEEIEDLDNLEKLLKDIPLAEFEVRKKIRAQIRILRVKQEDAKQKARQGIDSSNSKSTVEQAAVPSEPQASREESEGEEEPAAEVTSLINVSWSSEEQTTEQKETCKSTDDASSTLSSLTASSDAASECASDVDMPGESHKQEEPSTKGALAPTPSGSSSGTDLTKKTKSNKPQQMDFRGQLQKRGGEASGGPNTTPGRKKTGPAQMDFRSLLKTTGGGTKQGASFTGQVDKARGKAGAEQVDFRSVLSKTTAVSAFGKKSQKGSGQPPKEAKPPMKKVQDFRKREAENSSSTGSRGEVKSMTEEKSQRKISSSDLLNLTYQPREASSGGDYLKQRGLRKGETQKPCEQTFTVTGQRSEGRSDNEKSKSTARKEKAAVSSSTEGDPDSTDENLSPTSPKSPTEQARTSREDSTTGESSSEEEPDGGSSTTVEVTVNGKPKAPDPAEVEVVFPLVQPAEDSASLNEPSDTKATKPGKDKVDGTKEPRKTVGQAADTKPVGKKTEVTQKSTSPGATFEIKAKMSVEVSGKDGTKKEVTQVKEKAEVHKTDGTTVTLTKTTKTTEVQKKAAPARGGASSIEARLAQMKKDRVMAKRQAAASTKNKRDAFKQQLESQSSSKTPVKRSFSSKSNVTLLMEWCRKRTAYHEGVDITNFTTSWANGLAFCALLNYFLPNKVPYESLKPDDKKGNWSLGFKVAGEEGIEPLLELEDVMCVDIPEPKSLITYIHFVYTHFMEKQQKQKAAAGK